MYFLEFIRIPKNPLAEDVMAVYIKTDPRDENFDFEIFQSVFPIFC